jgi:hypothetical protein
MTGRGRIARRSAIEELLQSSATSKRAGFAAGCGAARGTLLLCGGLAGMVELGATRLIEPRGCNRREYP